MTDTTPTPSAALVDEAAEMLGCKEAVHRGQALGWCAIHKSPLGSPCPPCPVAVDLAAKIAARDARRDAQTRADECEVLAAVAATDGPWSAKGVFTSDPMIEVYGQTVLVNPDLDGHEIAAQVLADAAFIEAAREDVPWLVSEVERLTTERYALAAQVARVESLAGQWERMADTAINPDSRDWLQACSETLRECLSGWQKMHAALTDTDADTSDTQSTVHEVSDE